jgi:hypothetical protein
MIALLIRTSVALVLTIGLLLLHLFFQYTLPYPLVTIDVFTIAAVVYIVSAERGAVVWYGAIGYFLLEAISGGTYGVYLLAGTLSILLGYWLHAYVVTNQVWHGVIMVATVITVSKFALLLITSALLGQVLFPDVSQLVSFVGYSVVGASSIALGTHWLLSKTPLYTTKRLYSSYE